MTKLTDLQSTLLATAAQHDGRSLLPPPEGHGAMSERIRKAIATLIKRNLAREIEAGSATPAWREEDGDLRFGVVITDAGLAAIGIEPEVSADIEAAVEAGAHASAADREVAPDVKGGANSGHDAGSVTPQPPQHRDSVRPTKAALVVGLLGREQGATLAELVAATGWLPHTTRAALTGLRKKGHAIAKSKRDEATCYRIAAGEAA